VLLALGGSDPTGLTPALAAALRDQDLRVNLGPGYRAAAPSHGEVVPGPHAFVAALAGAELLVAAFGHSLLEAAYLGVPALIVVTRDDHREHAEAFARNGTAEIVAPAMLRERVVALLADRAALEEMGRRGRDLVDGRGADRIVAAIRELAT
jgi:spore coat polysaccharide biosynthesis predicted glycosyltransferase SpsG